MTLDGEEFIRRFLLHTLPDGLHRIRHYGFLANGHRSARLQHCRGLLIALAGQSSASVGLVTDTAAVRLCPCCGGPIVILAIWYRGQTPPNWPAWNDGS